MTKAQVFDHLGHKYWIIRYIAILRIEFSFIIPMRKACFCAIEGVFTLVARLTPKSSSFAECKHKHVAPMSASKGYLTHARFLCTWAQTARLRCGSNRARARMCAVIVFHWLSTLNTWPYTVDVGKTCCVLAACRPTLCISPPTVLDCVVHMQACQGTVLNCGPFIALCWGWCEFWL